MWHHFQATHAGHSDVADDQTKRALAQTDQRFLGRTSCLAVHFHGQKVGKDLRYFSFIIDDQNSRWETLLAHGAFLLLLNDWWRSSNRIAFAGTGRE